jgi:predicted nucleotidyltransferase
MDFDPTEIVRALDAQGVRYVLIGGMAATIHGADYVTGDVDITPATDTDNLTRLSTALDDLDARIRVPDEAAGIPFSHDATSLATVALWNLVTRAGDLDISFVPSGTQGYADLRRDAVTVVIHGVSVSVASLADVVRSKEAAGRDKDRLALPMLRRLLAEQPRDR